MDKQYIGDSVYAELQESGNVLLTTDNGLWDDPRNGNRIFLEPAVLIELVAYAQKHGLVKCIHKQEKVEYHDD